MCATYLKIQERGSTQGKPRANSLSELSGRSIDISPVNLQVRPVQANRLPSVLPTPIEGAAEPRRKPSHTRATTSHGGVRGHHPRPHKAWQGRTRKAQAQQASQKFVENVMGQTAGRASVHRCNILIYTVLECIPKGCMAKRMHEIGDISLKRSLLASPPIQAETFKRNIFLN